MSFQLLLKFIHIVLYVTDNNNTIQPIETEVVSSVLVDKSSPVAPASKGMLNFFLLPCMYVNGTINPKVMNK